MLRLTGPRVVVVLVAVVLVGYTFVVAPRLARVAGIHVSWSTAAEAGPGPVAGSSSAVFPPDGKAFVGVATAEGSHDLAPVDTFARAARHKPTVLLFTEGWAVDRFNRATFDRIADRGMLPMLSWEPWDYRAPAGADNSRSAQPRFRMSHVIDGEFDSYIRSYAAGIKRLNYRVAIRFAHEMNGFWYPWSEQSNGNKAGDYVKMWRHVHDLFTAAGVTNVIWVWSANVSYTNSTSLSGLYPGDSYVDWVGLSGYYGTQGSENYRPFESIFDTTITEIRAFSRKPLVITEVGATDTAGRKAEWIQGMYAALPQRTDVIGLIWYEAIKEADWRIVSSPGVAAAFAAGAASPRYDVTWTPDAVPRALVDIPTVRPSPSMTATSSAAADGAGAVRPQPRPTTARPGAPRPTTARPTTAAPPPPPPTTAAPPPPTTAPPRSPPAGP